jgi:hypothetical protein
MFVVLRLIGLILIALGLMLVGADLVTTLETHKPLIRPLADVWTLLDRGLHIKHEGAGPLLDWAKRVLPGFLSGTLATILGWWGGAVVGVLGVLISFAFGRRSGP